MVCVDKGLCNTCIQCPASQVAGPITSLAHMIELVFDG